jgi:hypothetical protein
MSGDLQIHFQLGAKNYTVDFKKQTQTGNKDSVLIGGVSYSLKGSDEAIYFVAKCLAQLPRNSTENLEQTGKELKARYATP